MLFSNESDFGNIEYKLNLNNMTNNKIEKYSSQLKYRVIEGNGESIYIIGINDYGNICGLESIDNTIKIFNFICKNVNCSIQFILKCKFNNKKFLIMKIISNFDTNLIPYYFEN